VRERPLTDIGKKYTTGEEIANSVTHGIGAALSVAGLAVLVTLAAMHGDAWRVVSFSVYGASLVLLYLASTFYHSFQSPQVKRVFRILDHSAIYVLIAGSYTPFTLVSIRGAWGWSLFGVIWGLAAAGIVLEAVFAKGKGFRLLNIGVYIAMGWLIVIAIKPLLANVPRGGLVWLFGGGLCYTLGAGLYAIKRIPFNHAIWHLFVLGGSICHYFAILFYVLPMA
jgi:hemolysin III